MVLVVVEPEGDGRWHARTEVAEQAGHAVEGHVREAQVVAHFMAGQTQRVVQRTRNQLRSEQLLRQRQILAQRATLQDYHH